MASRRIRRTKSLAGYTAAVYQDLIDLKSRGNYRSIAASAITGGGLAEEIELINKSLQSSNYMPGVDGWKIDGSGNAEFGNVYVRGDINAYSGTIGYWNISNPSVERTFGDTTLFGTFLESFDHGFTDEGSTIGSYVSLFKSYVDIPSVITKISVTSDVVTITVPDHNFIIGDKIIIEFDDAAYAGYESSTYLTVTETTPDTFSYIKRIQNSGESGNTVVEVEASGVAQIYNEDIAGLYLRDYSKASFDYGFFSNKGIAYSSAEVLNLVHNPSFEYLDSNFEPALRSVSTTGWSATSGIGNYYFPQDNPYARYSSQFGASIAWTSSARTDYLLATVDYKAGDNYDIFDGTRPLYFGFDMHSDSPSASRTLSTITVTNSSVVTIVTTTSHGYSTGDYVYLDFGADGLTSENGYTYDPSNTYGPRVFEITVTNSTTFTIPNLVGGAVESLQIYGNSRIYKVISPAFKLSEMLIKFGSDITTTLADVLTDVYLNNEDGSGWFTASNREISISATTRAESFIDGTPVPPMVNASGTSYVLIDPKKVRDLYESKAPTEFLNKDPFYIMFPAWLYKKDLTGTTTATKLLNTKYVLDNVYLSKSTQFFYGASGSDNNSWYTLGSGTSAPAQASVQNPRLWLEIDLDAQTSVLNYVDYIGIQSKNYNQSLFESSSISTEPRATTHTYKDYGLDSPSLFTIDSNVLNISSGLVSYETGVSLDLVELESYLNLSVNKTRTGAELVAKSDIFTSDKTASIGVFVDKSGKSLLSIDADYIVANTVNFINEDGDPSLNAHYEGNNTSDSGGLGTNHLAYTVQGTTVTTTSTSYAANATQCFAYFTTGASGWAEVHVYGYLDNDSASGITYLSFEIALASNLASPVVAASDNRAVINLGTPQGAASTFYLFDGLPNTRYKIRTMHRTTTGTTGSLYTRSVMVIPIT